MPDLNEIVKVDWPNWWKGKGNHFLEGMPYIGTHRRIIKEIQSILALRSCDEFDLVWSERGHAFEDYKIVSEKVKVVMNGYIKWPNNFFYPDDKTALLLGLIPGVWFDPEDPVDEIKLFFKEADSRIVESQFYEVIISGTFIDLVGMFGKGSRKGVGP